MLTAGPSRSVLTPLVLECLDVGGGQPFAADAPMSAGKFLHADPGDTPHRFALDLHHHVGNLTDHLLLLAFVEDAFDELNIYEWHDHSFLTLASRSSRCAVSLSHTGAL